MVVYQSGQIPRKLPYPKKFLVMRLRLQISRKRYENLSKEEKEKIHVMVMNYIKSFLNMKNEGFLGIEKIITK